MIKQSLIRFADDNRKNAYVTMQIFYRNKRSYVWIVYLRILNRQFAIKMISYALTILILINTM